MMTEQDYIKSLQADAAHLSRSYDLLFETHQREIKRLEAERDAALEVAKRGADECEILRNHRGQLENVLADILEHPDASRGIQNIARAALGMPDDGERHE